MPASTPSPSPLAPLPEAARGEKNKRLFQRRLFRLLLVVASLLALLTARPYAGGWNDSSRLATVESLVDRGTFQIDESIYVDTSRAARPPFDEVAESYARYGTKDKMLIDRHFYSDKSPVPAVLMAGVYQVLKWCGLNASERPDWFARLMTWLFAGAPYVFAVWCVARTARHLGVPPPWKLLLTASFAFGSLATCYVQHVNAHILLLGVAAGLCEALTRPPMVGSAKPSPTLRMIWIGTLAGFAYTVDLGAGPLLTASVGCYLLWRRRIQEPDAQAKEDYGEVLKSEVKCNQIPSLALQAPAHCMSILIFVLSALPWIVAHHALNYAIAGTIGPGNARPEYFAWPGSGFDSSNMTGSWNHASPERAALYALELLGGKKGFLLFTLPLVQAIFGAYWLLKSPPPRSGEGRARPSLIALTAWAIGTWLIYAATSRNYSGMCQSVRWFVPLLAPGFVALMILTRDYPRSRQPLAVLIAGGCLLNFELVARGPWNGRVPWLLWPVVGLTLTVWVSLWVLEFRSWRRISRLTPGVRTE